MKKYLKIISLLSIFLIMISFATQVLAYNAFDYAFTMGCILSDGKNTMEISERANYWYGTAGGGNKICYGLTTPNYNMLKNGYFVNGPRLLESGVIFLSGHANQTEMFWDDASGNSCGLYINGDVGNTYVGLDNINLSNTTLITFGGCHTGDGTQANLTAKAVQKGADAALGWTDFLPVGSFNNWADRYNQKLSQGYTMLEAAQHANGYIYLDSRVKSSAYAGNPNVRIKNTTRDLSIEEANLNVLNIESDNLTFFNTNQDFKNIINIIKNEDETFNENEYEVSVYKLDDETYTIDFIYKIGEVYTDMGYIVTVMNNEITKISNFMNNAVKENIKDIEAKITLDNSHIDNIERNAVNELQMRNVNTSTITVEENSSRYYYSSEENKLYYVVNTISQKGEAIIVDEYKQEI